MKIKWYAFIAEFSECPKIFICKTIKTAQAALTSHLRYSKKLSLQDFTCNLYWQEDFIRVSDISKYLTLRYVGLGIRVPVWPIKALEKTTLTNKIFKNKFNRESADIEILICIYWT